MFFWYMGIQGHLDRFGFVTYGGAGFQRSAAIGGLKDAIDQAEAKAR